MNRDFEKAKRRDKAKRSYDPIASFRPPKVTKRRLAKILSKIRAGKSRQRTHSSATAVERSSAGAIPVMKGNQTLKDRRFVPDECTPGEVGIPTKGSMLSPAISVRGIPDRCLE